MAFIVNVGLFVKAKINLQNAVDAAAWSGAAVQSRQLTKISYLNWELRNVYKEWMYKYYVLGQLNNPNIWDKIGAGGNVDYRLPNFNASDDVGDYFNIPSVCIHFSGTSNICAVYSVPGLPRFPEIQMPGIEDTAKAFVDTLVSKKGQDCAKRAGLNFSVAAAWAYGVDTSNSPFEDIPTIATDRPGAWPAAFELAVRIRNLENVVNTKPLTEGVCAGDCPHDLNDLYQSDTTSPPINERTVKAFLAAKRNLGNDRDLYQSFKMYELAPQSIPLTSITALNKVLMPGSSDNGNEKFYLDLHLNLINYVTFYTMFVPREGDMSGVPLEAQCAGSKMALPVPLYPQGFYKNPEVLTYYAVKGTAEFVGLFNPFTNNGIVEMEAFSAAKPYGGRIGPMLFGANSDKTSLNPRDDRVSVPYLSGIDIGNQNDPYKEGYPIPMIQDFWVKESQDTIGGWPNAGEATKFSIPNLLYDIAGDMAVHQGAGGDTVLKVVNEDIPSKGPSSLQAGLYSMDQFDALRGDLTDRNATYNLVAENLNRMRKPTKYEALNYLIPTAHDKSLFNSIAPLSPFAGSGQPVDPYKYELYAPLYGPGTLYNTLEDVMTIMEEFISISNVAVESYTNALKITAKALVEGVDSNPLYEDAARELHNDYDDRDPLHCGSMAGKFQHFFLGSGVIIDPAKCPTSTTLKDSVQKYFEDRVGNGDGHFATHYQGHFVDPDSNSEMMSAYSPGAKHGGDGAGTVKHPWTGKSKSYRRNFYSTKFIPLKSLVANENTGFGGNFAVYSEGNNSAPIEIRDNYTKLRNALQNSGEVSNITY